MQDFVHNDSFADLRQKLSTNLTHVESIRVGSMFTGWGVLEMVVKALKEEWNSANPTNAKLEVGKRRLGLQAMCLGNQPSTQSHSTLKPREKCRVSSSL